MSGHRSNPPARPRGSEPRTATAGKAQERKLPPPEAPRRPALRARLSGAMQAWLLRLHALTWRTQLHGIEQLDSRLARGERVLVAFWHGKYVPLFALLRGRRACIFSSRSFRGDVIAETCRRFGYECVQIPDRGGDASLAQMRQALGQFQAGGIAVDGPLGPYHAVKRGPVQLASDLGFTVLPVSVAARRNKILDERWDRMEIPRPFTTVWLEAGEPFEIPANLSPEEVKEWQQRLHDALDAVDRRVEERAESAS